MLVRIDEATVENGCLQMVADHPHRGLFRARAPRTEADMAGMQFEYCAEKHRSFAADIEREAGREYVFRV